MGDAVAGGGGAARSRAGAREQVRCVFYIAIVSLTTGSLQAVAERNIEVPEFDQDEKDTILARAHQSGALYSSTLHLILFFSCDFPPPLVNYCCLIHDAR